MRTLGIVRRRTRCVYCGTRIPGAVTRDERRATHRILPEHELAARLACDAHRELVLLDPAYEHLFSRRGEQERMKAAG